MTRRASDSEVAVKPHDTADVDPAKVASDLNLAATKLSQDNAYRRGLGRAIVLVRRAKKTGKGSTRVACDEIIADIRKEIGTKHGE